MRVIPLRRLPRAVGAAALALALAAGAVVAAPATAARAYTSDQWQVTEWTTLVLTTDRDQVSHFATPVAAGATVDDPVLGLVTIESPRAATASPDGTRAWVLGGPESGAPSTVTRVDVAPSGALSLPGTVIPVGRGAVDLALSPDTRHLYTADRDDDTVTVIDLAVPAVETRIEVPGGPVGIVVAPDGLRAAVTAAAGTISLLDLVTGEVVATRDLDGAPAGLAAGLGGASVYVSAGSPAVVTRLSFDAAFAVQDSERIALDANPNARPLVDSQASGLSVDPVSGDLWAADAGNDALVRFSTAGRALTPQDGAYGIWPDPGSRIAALPNGRGVDVWRDGLGDVARLQVDPTPVAYGAIQFGGAGAASRGSLLAMPIQAVTVTLAAPTGVRAGVPTTLTAVASRPADIVRYEWDFRDGTTAVTFDPTITHAFAAEGAYSVEVRAVTSVGAAFVALGTTFGFGTEGVHSGRSTVYHGVPEASATAVVRIAPAGISGSASWFTADPATLTHVLWTVPDGVTELTIDAAGQPGQPGETGRWEGCDAVPGLDLCGLDGGTGGARGTVRTTIPVGGPDDLVQPGTVLTVIVGHPGYVDVPHNHLIGGRGGSASTGAYGDGGAGGGGSGVYIQDASIAFPWLVVGAGGGGGGGHGLLVAEEWGGSAVNGITLNAHFGQWAIDAAQGGSGHYPGDPLDNYGGAPRLAGSCDIPGYPANAASPFHTDGWMQHGSNGSDGYGTSAGGGGGGGGGCLGATGGGSHYEHGGAGGGGGVNYARYGGGPVPAALSGDAYVSIAWEGETPTTLPARFTSASEARFTVGESGVMPLTLAGVADSVTASGTWPAGLTMLCGGLDAQCAIGGAPTAGTAGSYDLTFTTAESGASRTVHLVVDEAPAITTAPAAIAAAPGVAAEIGLGSSGAPGRRLALRGELPAGLSFVDNGDGTGTLRGTAAPGTDGSYPLRLVVAQDARSLPVDPAGTWEYRDVELTVTPAPDLTVAASHDAEFLEGDTGREIALTVTNGGSAATDGSEASVVYGLAATGLIPTALAGVGWDCTLASLSCTRSDVLAAGASWPEIVLTADVRVGVGLGAATNEATVTAADDIRHGNDTATDVTTIADVASPVAGDDEYAVGHRTPLAVAAAAGVLGDDSAAAGGALTAVLMSAPESGTLSLAPDGSFSYTPDAGFSGTDSFTYRIVDRIGQTSAIATVRLAVLPAPAALTIAASTTSPRQGGSVTLSAFADGIDVTAFTTFTSSVRTDVVVGNVVTFPHASPHTLTAHYGGAEASILLQVTPAAAAGGASLSGSGVEVAPAIGAALALLLVGALLLVAAARRRRV